MFEKDLVLIDSSGFAAVLPVFVDLAVDVFLTLELSESTGVLGLPVEAGTNSLIIKSQPGNKGTSVGVTNKSVMSVRSHVPKYTAGGRTNLYCN